MKTFAKEFISMCGIEEINEYAKVNNLEIVSVNLAIHQHRSMGDRFHYIAVFKINEDNELNRYLLNMTFRAGSDEPEDTDNAMYLIETYEDYSEEKLKKVIEKVNSLLDTFNDDKEAKDFPMSYDDGLNIETLMAGVGVYTKSKIKKLEPEDIENVDARREFVIKKYFEIEQYQ